MGSLLYLASRRNSANIKLRICNTWVGFPTDYLDNAGLGHKARALYSSLFGSVSTGNALLPRITVFFLG
jgi:hypothetical protein